VTTEQKRTGALERVDRILNRGGDADDVLRDVLAALESLYPFAGIEFVESGSLVQGPSIGSRGSWDDTRFPVVFQGTKVAELVAQGSSADDAEFLERVALLISPYCLVGWDTGGERWEP